MRRVTGLTGFLTCIMIQGCGSKQQDKAEVPPIAFESPIDGIATYYDATGAGACSFPASPDNLMVAALNAEQFATASWCGACAEIEGAKGKTTVRIVDLCPECAYGHLDLSREAFAKIDDMEKGRVPLRWRFVACETKPFMSYHYKDGSSRYWQALQIRDHRLPIQSLAIRVADEWRTLERSSYNYFIHPATVVDSPLSIRIQAIDGSTREETLPTPASDLLVPGTLQF